MIETKPQEMEAQLLLEMILQKYQLRQISNRTPWQPYLKTTPSVNDEPRAQTGSMDDPSNDPKAGLIATHILRYHHPSRTARWIFASFKKTS